MDAERFARVEVASAAELRAWLLAHHGQEESVWLVTFKRHVADRYVPTSAILDELIAFGWIDGRRMRLDADRVMQLIAPRRQQIWAQTYKDRAARLEAEGRMHEAGRAAVARSQALGLWDALADVDALEVPDDLAAALTARPPAARAFAAFAPSYRRNVLRWIALAKRTETRAKRVAMVATLAAQREKVPQF